MEFVKFPKIPRLKNVLMTITEKIDGTNAQINIPGDCLIFDCPGQAERYNIDGNNPKPKRKKK